MTLLSQRGVFGMEMVTGFVGGLIGSSLFAWLAKLIAGAWVERKIGERFDKEMVTFKADLDKRNTKELEGLKSQLRVEASRRETQYKELQVRRIDVLTEYFGRLFELHKAIHDYVQVEDLHYEVDPADALQNKEKAIAEYMPAYRKCIVFLPRGLRDDMAKYNSCAIHVLTSYDDLQTKDGFSGEQRKTHYQQLTDKKKEMGVAVERIESGVKRVLGVDDTDIPTSTSGEDEATHTTDR